jgi:hypothetical protein
LEAQLALGRFCQGILANQTPFEAKQHDLVMQMIKIPNKPLTAS